MVSPALKVLIPVGLAATAGGIALVVGSKSASAATKATPPQEQGMPPELRAKMEAALRAAEPNIMRKVADEAERAGFKTQAASMRAAADAVERAMTDLKPAPALPPSSSGTPSSGTVSPGGVVTLPTPPPPVQTPPTGPVIREARVLVVKKGEGPFQMATRTKQRVPLEAARALRDGNIPFDADGMGRKSDGKGGFAPGLEPGDRLLVPDSWAPHPDITVQRVGIPAGVHGEDGPPDDRTLRRLAGRVAMEVTFSEKGRENREVIELYQKHEKENGRRRGACHGIYDAETAASLARHGIAPPLRFADGAEIYWPATKAAKAKRKVRELLELLATQDVPRSEEWAQAAANC